MDNETEAVMKKRVENQQGVDKKEATSPLYFGCLNNITQSSIRVPEIGTLMLLCVVTA